MNSLLRVTAISALVASAIAANALTISFQTEGSNAAGHGSDFTEVGSLVSVSEAQTAYRSGNDPLFSVDSVVYSFTESAPGATLPSYSLITGGEGTIAGLYGTDAYTLDFTINAGGVIKGDTSNDRSFAGNIFSFVINGGGAIDGLTGTGKFGGTLNGNSDIYSGTSKTSFDLQAVPEPAPIAMFAVAGLGLLLRRRK